MASETTGTDLAMMRRLNERAVLASLWDADEALTSTQLAEATGLSRTTVEAVLTDLLDSSYVTVETTRTGRAGRPARRYAFDAAGGSLIAVDIGPGAITGLAGDLRGAPLTRPTRWEMDLRDPEVALSAIRAMVDALVQEGGPDAQRIDSLIVGMPAVIDPAGAPVLSHVVPAWITGDLRTGVAAAFPSVSVSFDNDTKLAAHLEAMSGSVVPGETAVLLRTGHRISAASIINGDVAMGANGAAGEIGSLANIGWRGARLALTAGSADTVAEAFEAADEGDPTALDAVRAFAEQIALGAAAMALTLDPHAIILNTTIPRSESTLPAMLQDAIARRLMFPIEFRTSELGPDAPCRGALLRSAAAVRDRLLS